MWPVFVKGNTARAVSAAPGGCVGLLVCLCTSPHEFIDDALQVFVQQHKLPGTVDHSGARSITRVRLVNGCGILPHATHARGVSVVWQVIGAPPQTPTVLSALYRSRKHTGLRDRLYWPSHDRV